MSIRVNMNDLSWETRQRIHKDLTLKIELGKYAMGKCRYIYPFVIEGDYIKLPFAYAAKTLKLPRPSRDKFPKMEAKFEGKLRPKQKQVHIEALGVLNKKGSVTVSCYTGWGKSIGAIKLGIDIGFKMLIIVNKIVLMKQWESSILRFCPTATVQRVTPKSKKKDCDFYIMNAINVKKMGEEFFNDVGTVAVDEYHLIMAEKLSEALQYVYPRYMIGLSATPYRNDGLNILLDLYFGKDKIIRELKRDHLVYKVTTGFKPRVEYNMIGKRRVLNWGVILESQAEDVNRNELIIKIVREFSKRTFLIPVKRVFHGEYLIRRLREEGESVTSLLGSEQTFDANARILIGTTQKVGTGFDHDKIDAMILATDVQDYFIQLLGRCFRTEEVVPIIFDIVDQHSTLERHYDTRRDVYLNATGKIKNFEI
jgi:superfamily II DNA or RNA helicase